MCGLPPQIPVNMLPNFMGGAFDPPTILQDKVASPLQQVPNGGNIGTGWAPPNSIPVTPSTSGPLQVPSAPWLPPTTGQPALHVDPSKHDLNPSPSPPQPGWYHVWYVPPGPYASQPVSAAPPYTSPDAQTAPPTAVPPTLAPPTAGTPTSAPPTAVQHMPAPPTAAPLSMPAPQPSVSLMHAGPCHEPDKFAEGLRG